MKSIAHMADEAMKNLVESKAAVQVQSHPITRTIRSSISGIECMHMATKAKFTSSLEENTRNSNCGSTP